MRPEATIFHRRWIAKCSSRNPGKSFTAVARPRNTPHQTGRPERAVTQTNVSNSSSTRFSCPWFICWRKGLHNNSSPISGHNAQGDQPTPRPRPNNHRLAPRAASDTRFQANVACR